MVCHMKFVPISKVTLCLLDVSSRFCEQDDSWIFFFEVCAHAFEDLVRFGETPRVRTFALDEVRGGIDAKPICTKMCKEIHIVEHCGDDLFVIPVEIGLLWIEGRIIVIIGLWVSDPVVLLYSRESVDASS